MLLEGVDSMDGVPACLSSYSTPPLPALLPPSVRYVCSCFIVVHSFFTLNPRPAPTKNSTNRVV